LLLLVLFVAPYAARTAMWLTVNKSQAVMEAKLVELQAATDAVAGVLRSSDLPGAPVAADALDDLILPSPCFAEECQGWQVWRLLVGFDREPWFWILALSLLLYNICQVVLTYTIAPLRDEEEWSGRSPAWDDYRLCLWPHRFVQVLRVAAVVAFLWHGFDWLTREVLLPATVAVERTASALGGESG